MQKNYDTDDSVNTEKTCNVSYEGGKLHCTDVWSKQHIPVEYDKRADSLHNAMDV